jgi:hypothetical protein
MGDTLMVLLGGIWYYWKINGVCIGKCPFDEIFKYEADMKYSVQSPAESWQNLEISYEVFLMIDLSKPGCPLVFGVIEMVK